MEAKEVSQINKSYGNLFGIVDEEVEEEGEESGGEGEDGGTDKEADGVPNTFAKKWGWLNLVREVSDTTHLSWADVFSMNILEFLNINCYIRDYNNWQRSEMDKWRRTH